MAATERAVQGGGGPSTRHALIAAILLLAAAPVAAQERTEGLVVVQPGPVVTPTSSLLPVREVSMTDPTSSAERDDAILNGALIALGTLGIVDNVVIHWILGWHRIIEDSPHALEMEIAVVAVSTAMLVTGLVRERRARRK